MKPRKMIYLSLLLVCLSLTAPTRADLDENWKAAHYQVFATTGAPLEPEKTRKLIEQLMLSYGNKDDPETSRRREKLAPLFELSKLDGRKCTLDEFARSSRLLAYESIFIINLVPYLRYFRFEQFKLCLGRFESEVAKEAAGLSESEVEKVRSLREHVEAAWQHKILPPFFVAPHKSLAEGVAAFLEQSGVLEGLAESTQRRLKFDFIFLQRVGVLCGALIKQLDHSMQQLGAYRFDKRVAKLLSETTLEWATNYELCRDIQAFHGLHKDAYKVFKQSHELNRSRLSKLIPQRFVKKHQKQ